MPSRELPYPLFDADNHMYETEDAFTRHLPRQYRGAIEYVQVRGRTKIAVRGQISNYIPNPTFEVVARPGAQEEYFKHGNPEGKSYRELVGEPIRSVPAFREPGSRLELMDEQGIQRTLMFPTLASLLEERMRDDPELTHAVVHALNQWMDEVWSFNYKDRIFATPVITLPIVAEAVKELEWCLERGARAVLVRPAPVPGFRGPRSFALPEFDPFWKLVQDSGTLVAFHSSDSGYERFAGEWEGAQREFLPFQPQPFRQIGQWRAIEDAVGSLVCHGCLSRFPELKLAIVETGSSWVRPLVEKLAEIYKKMPHGFQEDPVEQVRRLIHVSPFIEDDMPALADLIGVDRVLFGSDYPHPEGKADPITYVDDLPTFSDEDKAKVMGGNLGRLARVQDMNRAGILASLCFPSVTRFCGQIFYEAKDREFGFTCLRAYNDWMIEEWCAAAPGRYIPLVLIPLWDPALAARELERCAAKGATTFAFSENPEPLGLPTIHDKDGYWEPVMAAANALEMVASMHVGSSSTLPQICSDAPFMANLTWGASRTSGTMLSWLFSGLFQRYPKLKIALSEGEAGWMPYFLERAEQVLDKQRHWVTKGVRFMEHGGSGAIDLDDLDLRADFRDHIYLCIIDDAHAIASLGEIPEDNLMCETDYPHSDTTWPDSIQVVKNRVGHLPAETQYKILRGNAERLYRFTPAEPPVAAGV